MTGITSTSKYLYFESATSLTIGYMSMFYDPLYSLFSSNYRWLLVSRKRYFLSGRFDFILPGLMFHKGLFLDALLPYL